MRLKAVEEVTIVRPSIAKGLFTLSVPIGLPGGEGMVAKWGPRDIENHSTKVMGDSIWNVVRAGRYSLSVIVQAE